MFDQTAKLTPSGLRPLFRARAILVVSVGSLTGLAAFSAGEFARDQAERGLAANATASAVLHASVLRSELERYRLVPVVLAQDAQMARLLDGASDASSSLQINEKLGRLASQTRAAAIYLLDSRGVAKASSNWQLPTSFVGSDYSFRPYFTRAMDGGDAEFFALGTISGRPGLFLSRRIMSPDGRPVGVAVVKVEFDTLEADWRASGKPAYVSDPNGVILITSVPQWRFRTVAPMTPLQRSRVQTGQTLGQNTLGPLAFQGGGQSRPVLVLASTDDTAPQEWMTAEIATSTPGWKLHLLMPAGDVILTAVANARAVAALITLLLSGALAFLWQRRRRAAALARIEEDSRAVLELRISERTTELRQANEALNAQIEERRRAEAGREILRDELIQANKLATLGQIAAGVAHEINQPVAAIRMHADTAVTHLDRNDGDAARRTLDRIADLTGRIGIITDELRAFSRKSTAAPSSISPAAAIDGALLLLSGRLRQSDLVIAQPPVDPDLRVFADPLRLEQVIVNLLQNSIEAMEGLRAEDARIEICVEQVGSRVEIIIADTGPGLSPEVSEALFTPFLTTKRKGLGLGLVICRDILAAIGGELTLRPAECGTTFVIGLKAG
jgi:two-component system C4-dicarboxylate transport sensor histidine kinase DctB